MAKEISRTFDLKRGAVVVNIEDPLGNVSVHTLYLAKVPSVAAEVTKRLAEADSSSALIHTRMVAAGWKPTP